MCEERSRAKLRIIRPFKRLGILPEDFQQPKSQGMLFPMPKHGLLIFINFPDVTETEFQHTLEYARPSLILELRSSPRFDIGTFNRQLAFQSFRNQNATYMDLTSSLMGRNDRNAVLSNLRKFLETSKPSFDRPVVFLFSRAESDDDFRRQVWTTVSSFNSAATEVYEVPRISAD
jgi:hypothetical protein